jgi:ABC-type uncharacterized transport system substrate-binding protein
MLTVSRDFHDGGIASAQLAVRVLNGESPATIPFQLVLLDDDVFVEGEMSTRYVAEIMSKWMSSKA